MKLRAAVKYAIFLGRNICFCHQVQSVAYPFFFSLSPNSVNAPFGNLSQDLSSFSFIFFFFFFYFFNLTSAKKAPVSSHVLLNMSVFLQSKHGTRSILLGMILSFLSLSSLAPPAECRCSAGCDLALASYYVWRGTNLTFISQLFNVPRSDIVAYSPPENIPNQDNVLADTRILVPFRCDCLGNGEFLGKVFSYSVSPGDTYEPVAETYYSNLTTVDWLKRSNPNYPENNIPDTPGTTLNVTVNCSCGNKDVSEDYGLFVTYPLRPGENLSSVANAANVSEDLVRRYNPGVNFNAGSGLVFIPGRGICYSRIHHSFPR